MNLSLCGNFCLNVTKTNRHHAAATIVDMLLSVYLQTCLFSDFELLADPTSAFTAKWQTKNIITEKDNIDFLTSVTCQIIVRMYPKRNVRIRSKAKTEILYDYN